MNQQEHDIEAMEGLVPALAARALGEAHQRALASGYSVVVSDADGLYRVMPSGARILIKRLEKPLSIPIGTRVLIP